MFEKYNEVAAKYQMSVDTEGFIHFENGRKSSIQIRLKKGRMRVETVQKNLLFSSGLAPENLGSFIERFWLKDKPQDNS